MDIVYGYWMDISLSIIILQKISRKNTFTCSHDSGSGVEEMLSDEFFSGVT